MSDISPRRFPSAAKQGAAAQLHPLRRGTVLRKPGSNEAAIVIGPHEFEPDVAEAVHGYVDERPTCGTFPVFFKYTREGRSWRIATPSDATKVRALFIAHATAWGPDSRGWIAAEEEGRDGWLSPPVAMLWDSAGGDR